MNGNAVRPSVLLLDVNGEYNPEDDNIPRYLPGKSFRSRGPFLDSGGHS